MLDLTPYNLSENEKSVFSYFEELSSIPRGSGNMKKISNYCVEFAKKFKLKYIRDDADNVVIFKPATTGFENAEPIILQGHLDIVCQKTEACEIDFLTDGLEIFRDGDFIKADGTTLGADNGIALAYIFAILASNNIAHPPIEAVLTSDEEIGLIGAGTLDKSLLKAKRMINIDSENDDILTVSCAGGQDVILELPVNRTLKNGFDLTLTITGLLGGHSGVEIDKGRTNANKLMGKILKYLAEKSDFNLISIDGGTKPNAIPNSVTAVICSDNAENLIANLEIAENLYFQDVKANEPDICLEIGKGSLGNYECFEDKDTLIELLNKTPDGVIKMSDEIEGLVETSLNLGILATTKDKVLAHFALRSNKEAKLKRLTEEIITIGKQLGATTEASGFYPPWEYNPVSPLRELYKQCYLKQYGTEIKVEAIHAGLECAIFSSSVENLDCISVGPNIFDVHTVNERLSIPSTVRTFNLLLNVLSKCCNL